MRFVTVLKISFFAFILSFVALPSQAQTSPPFYCHQRIHEIEWSPDGEKLAVMTSQGAVIYDHDLNLIHSIEAPDFAYSHHHTVGYMTWSPDNQWLMLPGLYDPEIYGTMGGYYGWVIANTQTGELLPMSSFGNLRELVWSPDNQFIMALTYDPGLGLAPDFSTIFIVGGIQEEPVEPISRQFQEIIFKNIQWHEDNTISIQYDNITIYLDTNLELLERAPTIAPRRMISNQDGTLEAGMNPYINFVVRESGEEEQVITIDAHLDSNREFVKLGEIDEIIWLNDDEYLIGLYSRRSQYILSEFPEMSRLLQGIIVNARTATLDNQFLLETEAHISGYSVSTRGDRIALYHSETQLELWNPQTEERLASIEIAPLTNMDDC